MINEAFLNDQSSILDIFMGIFEFGRRLKPRIKKRKAAALDAVGEAKLMINVIRGTDVPVRTSFFERFLHYIENNGAEKERQAAYKDLYFLK